MSKRNYNSRQTTVGITTGLDDSNEKRNNSTGETAVKSPVEKTSKRSKTRTKSKKGGKLNIAKQMKTNTPDGKTFHLGSNPKSNEISWYTQVASILAPVLKVASVPYKGRAYPLFPIEHVFNTTQSHAEELEEFTHQLPGLMVNYIQPTMPLGSLEHNLLSNDNLVHVTSSYVGDVHDNMLNLLSRNLFSQLRQRITGGATKIYNPSDIMSYLFVMSSIFAYLSHLDLLLKVTYQANPWSHYKFEHIVDKIGKRGDYSTIITMGPLLINRLNRIKVALRSFLLPNGISLVKRWSWLYRDIYADSTNPHPQYFANVPNGFYTLDYSASPIREETVGLKAYDGTVYKVKFINTTDKNIQDKMELLENAIYTLTENDAFLYINSDLQRAYGVDGLDYTHVVPTPEIAPLVYVPVYDKEFLIQLSNATINPIDIDSFKVELDTQLTNFKIKVEYSQDTVNRYRKQSDSKNTTVSFNTAVLFHDNFSMSEPETLIATRLTSLVISTNSTQGAKPLFITGTDFINKSEIIYVGNNVSVWVRRNTVNTQYIRNNLDSSRSTNELLYLMASNQFNYSPNIYVTQATNHQEVNKQVVTFSKNVENYSFMEHKQLKAIHEGAFASMVGLSDTSLLLSTLINKSNGK